MKILVVEDNPILQRQLTRALRGQSYAVDASGDGEDALFQIQNCSYDLVVLDIMLPGMDGLEILRQVRVDNKTPVLLLTARDSLNDRIQGLDYGADDYLTKPFELDELLARIRSILRRSKSSVQPTLFIGKVEIDTNTGKVHCDGKEVSLTAMEFAIVQKLAMARGKIVATPELLEAILDENDDTMSNALTVHIHNIRKKLGKEFIKTIRGRGYLVE